MTDNITQNPEDEWQNSGLAATHLYAGALRTLHRTNPWENIPVLPQAICHLMTELWDFGFTQTQIREAFEQALVELPKYTVGEEVRP
ncbi:MAG: hypothetical protein R3E18_04400 [Sphingomonadaceae bacterium]|nr:hypothetical protein [Sphingomonadaceae bacterium]